MNGLTFDLANILGLAGSALMLVAYAYSNMAQRLNFVVFNLANLIGAALLIASLSVHFNLASMALEIAWMLIAALALVKALREKSR